MFNKEIMSPEEAALIVQQANLVSRAFIADQIAQRPFSVQIETIDLSIAQLSTSPKHIRGQFRSIYIQDATDVNVEIQVRLGSMDSVQSAFTMKKNDSISLSQPLNDMFLHWDAQTSKSITIVKFTDAEFKSGSQISVTGGGVSIVDGSGFTQEVKSLAAGVAEEIFPQDSNRKMGTLENFSTSDIFVGPSTVTDSGSTRGYKISAGATFQWRNTQSLYAYCANAVDVLLMVES